MTNGSVTAVAKKGKTVNDPAGIEKWGPMWRSMDKAWRTVKLNWMAIGVDRKMVVDQRGKILSMVFKSSTLSTVQRALGLACNPSI